jgi:hypothetical protein
MFHRTQLQKVGLRDFLIREPEVVVSRCNFSFATFAQPLLTLTRKILS